jgi:dephospho-CoA kinase
MKDLNSIYDKVSVLTGTSGAGKSTAAKILEGLGVHIVSADFIAKNVVLPNSPGLEKLRSIFGDIILLEDRTLNRKKLHEILISDEQAKKEIESALHPLIQEQAKSKFQELVVNNHFPIIYDCPLFFEKNLKELGFKQSILIIAEEYLAIKRIITRDQITKEVAEMRINTQMPQSEKMKLADIVIENNGSISDLSAKLEKIFPKL